MSNTNQGAVSQGGNYSLQSRLSEVRGKLFNINKKVNDLEFNMVFLLGRPDLVDYSSGEDNNNHQEMGSGSVDTQSHSTDNSTYYRWEPTFITNPSELHSEIADCMNIKYSLLIEQKEIVGVMDADRKEVSHKNEAVYHYPGDENGKF